jgi:hypothetical protein
VGLGSLEVFHPSFRIENIVLFRLAQISVVMTITVSSKPLPLAPQHPGVREQLERVLKSAEFIQSERMRRFLRFIVEQSLAGELDMLKESVIGVHVFDRDPSYDPKSDPVVRTEARRRRAKLP